MTKTAAQLRAELEDVKSRLVRQEFPAGTPNRKALKRAENDRVMALRAKLGFDAINQQLGEAIIRERRAAVRADRDEATNAALRRRVLASLRRLGFRRETTSGQSAYYHHLAADLTVRISDHDVPLTAARESDMAHGGHSWALTDLSLVIDGNTTAREAGEWLVAIRRKIRSQA